MKIIFGILILLLSIESYSQKLKKNKNILDPYSYEVLYVLESDKGIKHGDYELFKNNSLCLKGKYENNKRVGIWNEYLKTDEGTLISKGKFKNNKKDSLWVQIINSEFISTEIKRSQGFYIEGQKTGNWVYYDREGKNPKAVGEYNNNKRIKKWKFFVNGTFAQLYDFTNDSLIVINNELTDKNKIISGGKYNNLIYVDKEATYKNGGMEGLLTYLSMSVRYPSESRELGISGRVYVKFKVTSKGDVEEVEIYRGLDEYINKEAIRVVKNIKNGFTPAIFEDEAVSIYLVVPINFKLM